MNQKSFLSGIVIVLSVIALALSFAAWRNRGELTGGEDTLARVQRTGKVDACVIVSPPYVIKDAKTGDLSGHMYEAMKTITERMKVKINVSETTYGNAAAELQSRRCDVVVERHDVEFLLHIE